MGLQTDNDRARGCYYQRPVRINGLEAIAEVEFKNGKTARGHRMHSSLSADANFTMGVKPHKFPERRCGTGKPNCVHRNVTESLPWKRYRASQFKKRCQAALGPITAARSGPERSMQAAIPHVSG
jgi:hypothetical protein